MSQKIHRIFGLGAALALVALASAQASSIGTCRYACRDNTSGQVTFRSGSTSESACCSGTGVSCPAGSTFVGAFAWNNQIISTC